VTPEFFRFDKQHFLWNVVIQVCQGKFDTGKDNFRVDLKFTAQIKNNTKISMDRELFFN
jgi:hypothetical protein